MIGHRLLGTTLFVWASTAEGLSISIKRSALYQPAAHRSLTTHLVMMSARQPWLAVLGNVDARVS